MKKHKKCTSRLSIKRGMDGIAEQSKGTEQVKIVEWGMGQM